MENNASNEDDARYHSIGSDGDEQGRPASRPAPSDMIDDRSGGSSARREQFPKEEPPAPDPAAGNRGRRASRGSGPVSGSGAGAGGKGNGEDYDSDPQGGDGRFPSPDEHGPKTGADAPVGGSR